jgi:hypothetical protein
MVLFGGRGNGTLLGDTWEWDGFAWLRHTPAHSPSPRSGATMTYDMHRGRMVLFGGTTALAPSDETWEWYATDWHLVTPASGSPSSRSEHVTTYDARARRVIVFGGFSSVPLADTWAWNGTAWTQVGLASAPLGRTAAAATYDRVRGKVLVFGGTPDAGAALGDLWAYGFASTDGPAEACTVNIDRDADGLAGCADPDCWGRCEPSCPPGASCSLSRERCGNGDCTAVENHVNCYVDCYWMAN